LACRSGLCGRAPAGLSREALVEIYLSLLEGMKARVMLGGLGGVGVEPAAAAITEVFLRGALAGRSSPVRP
jgi:hypothetical protein